MVVQLLMITCTLWSLVSFLEEAGIVCWSGGELALGILKKDFIIRLGWESLERFLMELNYNFTYQCLDLFFLYRLSSPW